MACVDCFSNCGGNIVSDKCVKYTGPDITFLGIEKGDQLSQVEAALIEKLETSLNGTGVTFEDFTACSSITTALGSNEETLSNIIQAMSDVICDLKTDVAELQVDVDPVASFTTPCLTLGTNPTRDQILQAIITKLCSLNTTVTTVSTNYVTTASLCTLVQDCLDDSVSNQEYTRMPKYVALPYHGSLTVFDSQGRGLSAAGYDKVYICNGQTVGTFTTPDYRGRSPLGVNQSIPGGAMDSSVDPSVSANAGYNFVVGTKKGNFTDVLTIANTPVHTHSTPSQVIPLYLPGQKGGDNDDHNNTTAFSGGDKAPSETIFNFTLNTNITVPATTSSSAGSSSAHNTTHPVIGTVFIIYIP